jgi:hypothetical protein
MQMAVNKDPKSLAPTGLRRSLKDDLGNVRAVPSALDNPARRPFARSLRREVLTGFTRTSPPSWQLQWLANGVANH